MAAEDHILDHLPDDVQALFNKPNVVPLSRYKAHAVAFADRSQIFPALAWSATCPPCDANFSVIGPDRLTPKNCPYCGRLAEDLFEVDLPGGAPPGLR